MADDNHISRETIFSAVVSEAAGFYKIITVTAGSYLGGSLFFMEKIAAKPKTWTLIVLAGGWLLLIASIGLVAWVRRLNLDAGQLALEGKYMDASSVDKKKRRLSIAALIVLMLGMVAVTAFSLVNAWIMSSN